MLVLSVVNYVEIIALLTSIFCFRKLQGTVLQLFPYFLLFIVITELAGLYTGKVLHKPNVWFYNITTVVEFCFYSFFFSKILKKNRKATSIILYIYPVLATLNILFVQGLTRFHSYTMVLGSLFMIFFSCCYFYESLLNPGKKQIQKEAVFWIVTGVFFFYLGDILYNTLFNILTKYQVNIAAKLFLAINNNLVIVLYSCFTIGFIVWKNPMK